MLRPDTEQAWSFLKVQPALSGFILVGGSALALHLRHRFSEDLDFAFHGDHLPRAGLEAVRRQATQAGIEFHPHDDPAALNEFAQGGLDLLDYQQDYVVNRSVKVSFFAPGSSTLAVLDGCMDSSGPRLASLDELFRTKSLLTASRSRTRDWFDLYVLMTRCGFSMARYHEAFRMGGVANQASIGLQRVCAENACAADEGFENLAPDAPSVAVIQQYFRDQRDAFERSEAAEAWRKANQGDCSISR